MAEQTRFTVESARAAAARGDLPRWVSEFLASPGSDNAVLAETLPAELGWWTGPVLLPRERLHRLAGPASEPVLCPVDDDYWDERVDEIDERIEDEGWEPPPIVVSLRGDDLVVEDGNHRLEGLRRAGRREVWAVVGFESEADAERFAASTS